MRIGNIIVGGLASVMGIGIIIFIARAIMRSSAFAGPSIVEIAIFLGIGGFLLKNPYLHNGAIPSIM